MDSGMWNPGCGTQFRKKLRQFKNNKLSSNFHNVKNEKTQ